MIEHLGFPHPGPLPEGALPQKAKLPQKGEGCLKSQVERVAGSVLISNGPGKRILCVTILPILKRQSRLRWGGDALQYGVGLRWREGVRGSQMSCP
jgi:hypothetical protein